MDHRKQIIENPSFGHLSTALSAHAFIAFANLLYRGIFFLSEGFGTLEVSGITCLPEQDKKVHWIL